MIKFIVLCLLSTLAFAGVDPSNKLKLGDGAASDKTIEFNKGLTTANPKLKWNNSTSKIQFSNDGTTFTDIGSGTGSSGNASIGNINLLTGLNNDFESGTTHWTASGGTFTNTTSGANLANGSKSGSFLASGSGQTLTTDSVTVPQGLQDTGKCFAQLGFYKYTGTANDYLFEVLDQSSSVIATYKEPTVTTTGAPQSTTFRSLSMLVPCSGVTSMTLRIKSNVASPGTVYIDDVYLGAARFFDPMDLPSYYGSLVYAGTTNCNWSQTVSSFTTFPADTDCPTPSVTGGLTAPATKIPSFVMNNAPPGVYEITIIGQLRDENASQACQFQLFDGTTASNRLGLGPGANAGDQEGGVTFYFTYATTGNHSIDIQARCDSAFTSSINGTDNVGLAFHVKRWPIRNQVP